MFVFGVSFIDSVVVNSFDVPLNISIDANAGVNIMGSTHVRFAITFVIGTGVNYNVAIGANSNVYILGLA